MEVKACGYCPIQKKDVSIMIKYIDSSTNEGREFSKQRLECDYKSSENPCPRNNCPIWKNAKETIRS